MQLLDLFWPKLGLGGVASGRLDYRWAGQPSGRANLKIRNLSRAGLVLASKPIDVGVNAVLDGSRAALRAVAVSDGKTIGRAQARFEWDDHSGIREDPVAVRCGRPGRPHERSARSSRWRLRSRRPNA